MRPVRTPFSVAFFHGSKLAGPRAGKNARCRVLTNAKSASTLNLPLLSAGIFPLFMTSSFIDEALKVIPNQQLLVNVVSKRVRQLTSGHRPLVDAGPRMGFSDIALKEIVEGKLNFESAPAPDAQSAE